MKDLTHYFGQSPKSDESSSSLKENEVVQAPAPEKTSVKKTQSSDVLKCKTPGNNVNDTDSPKPTSADSVNKSQSKGSAAKRKPTAKKKVSVNEDEDFEVKVVKRRGRSTRVKEEEAKVPVIKPDSVPENECADPSSSQGTVDQSNMSTKEEALVSPTPHDSVPESKSKPAKNIMHFFSPTKKTADVQPESGEVGECSADLQSPTASTDSKKKGKSESEEKVRTKKVSVRKSSKKVKEETSDFKSGSTMKNSKVSSKDDNSSADGITESLSKEKCEQKQSDIKSSVCNAFQMLMSKKQGAQVSTDTNDTPMTEKDQSSNEVLDQEDDDFEEKTPKVFAKRKKRNRIESDTDEDCQPESSNQQKKVATETEAPSSQDDSKRKSLKNYFQKISKEEAEVQSQKVQFKVEAIVHHSDGSPYKSKSKKEAGSQRVSKKKKIKQKRNENEIELLSSEVITVPEPAENAGPVPAASAKSENSDEEDVTRAAGKELDSSQPKKGKRTLKLSSSNSPRSKRLKKAVDKEEDCEATSEKVQVEETVNMKSPDSEGASSKNSAKKMKQPSLGSTFFRKQGSGDPVSAEVKEDPPKSETETPVMRSFPTVSLKQMSPRKLQKAGNAKEVLGKSSVKDMKLEVVVSCDGSEMSSPPRKSSRGIFAESPISPKQPPSDMQSPATRSWKMRVCLTPKAESKQTLSAPDTPSIVHSVPDDDHDIEELAVVKRKKKKSVSFDSEPKEPVLSPEDKEIKIVYEEKAVAGSSKSGPLCGVKLAPLFMRPKKLDRISEQAKQEFLQSGVPEQVKKMIEAQKSMECIEVELFPQISHVTQLEPVLPWAPSEAVLPLKPESPANDPVPSGRLNMGDMTSCDPVGCEMAEVLSNCSTSLLRQNKRIDLENVPAVLSVIRSQNPDFEVIRYFKRLREKYRKVLDPELSAAEGGKRKRSRSARRSRGSNQGVNSPKPVRAAPSLMWTVKYRSTSSDDIVGNEVSVQALKQWLEGLRRLSETGQAHTAKPKKLKKNDYEDDFIVSDENFDSNSSSASLSNSALLLGPHGSGKTNCVYALAADLGYKVLEINASERRSGKIILAKLSEATQSHQVASRSQEQSSAANFFTPKTSAKPKAVKRKIEKKKEPEEESTKNKLSLILIKDIDIVFEEEDEGFVSAVSSLISTSKRPVIFTTTEIDSAPQRRLVNSSTLLLEFTPDAKALCSWLQVVALVEGIYVSQTALNDLLSSCNKDVRRCLLQLQVWMSTGGNHLLASANVKDEATYKQEKDRLQEFLECNVNEDSLNAQVDRSSLSVLEHHDCLGALQGRNDIDLGKDFSRVSLPVPVSFGRLWWNIPLLLDLPQVEVSKLSVPDLPEEPRRFRGIFDDTIFDMTSDDEDSRSVAGSQPKLPEESVQPAESEPKSSENDPKPAESEPETEPSLFDVERCSQEEVDAMLSHLQALSTCDLIATATRLPEVSCDFEPTPRSWQTVPRASLCTDIPVTDGPNLLEEETSRSLCHWLTETSIGHARSILHEAPSPAQYNALLPNHEIQRRRLAVADAEQVVLGGVASCARLERSAIALDYLPTFRRICASEQKRSETNCSRRNRFYHYFKGVGLYLSPDQTVTLSST